MKYFKFFIINVIAFSLLFFLISLLFPSQVVITKTAAIAGTKEKVKEKLSNTADWKNWNQFINGDAVEKNNQKASDTMLLFSFRNNGDELLTSQFNFYNSDSSSVLLNWSLIEKLPWYKPWKKFKAMVLNKEMAAVMDTSLNTFKAQVEMAK